MNLKQYFVALCASAAALLGRKRKTPKTALPKPVLPKKGRRPSVSIEERKSLAYGAFPNHFGNYLGKRLPRPASWPITARERFVRLLGMFEERAGNYRFKQLRV